MKVLIGIPTYSGNLNIELIKFLDKVMLPEGSTFAKAYVTRTPIHMARNILIEKMLEGGFTHCIMIDDDQYPINKDCFFKLLTAGKDMVSGVVRLRIKKENLNILHKEKYTEGDLDGMYRYTPYKEIPQKGLFKIDNAGSGLICLSRKVCQDMYNKYSKEPFESKQTTYVKQANGEFSEFGYHNNDIAYNEKGSPILCRRVLSEDYLFFERAISLGYDLRCEPQSTCVHLGNPELIFP